MKKIIINFTSLLPVLFWAVLGSSVIAGAGIMVYWDLTLPYHGGISASVIDGFFGALVSSLFFGIGYYELTQID